MRFPKFLRQSAFSLVEMQVSILIASILVLAVGAITSISMQAYNDLRCEGAIYGDISYGFKLVQNRVRECRSQPSVKSLSSSHWLDAEQLVIGQSAFGLYKASVDAPIEFVHLKNHLDEGDREVIFSVPSDDEINLTLDVTSKYVAVQLEGVKKKIPFDLSTHIVRRTL